MSLSLDPESYRGKYKADDEEHLYFDWKLKTGDIYEFAGKILIN